MSSRGGPSPFDFGRVRRTGSIASDRPRHLAFTARWSGMEAEAPPAGRPRSQSIERGRQRICWRFSTRGGCRWWKSSTPMPTAGSAWQVAGLVPVRLSWDGAVPARRAGQGRSTGTDGEAQRVAAYDNGKEAARHVAIAANQGVARTYPAGGRCSITTGSSRSTTEGSSSDTTSWNAEQLVPLLEQECIGPRRPR